MVRGDVENERLRDAESRVLERLKHRLFFAAAVL
jgi:hypothetical protein